MIKDVEKFLDFLGEIGEWIWRKGKYGDLSKESLDNFIIFCYSKGMNVNKIVYEIENDRTFCRILGIDYVTLKDSWKATDYVKNFITSLELSKIEKSKIEKNEQRKNF